MEINLLNRQRGRLVDRGVILAFARQLVAALPPRAGDALGICLVSDRRMREANRRFRDRDATTDVLSFPGDGTADPDGTSHLGDILISVETASRQAREAGVTLEHELRTLLIHGYLHLLGYDHETDDGTMMRLQHRLERRLSSNGRTRRTRD